VIVMPRTTPEIKVEAVAAMGAELVLEGDSYSDAQVHCDRLAKERGLSFVHPFDDPLVIAGQGTVGEEIVRQAHGRLDVVFVPVGGGGLLAGVGGYIKALLPEVAVIGVEPFEADAMHRSLERGAREARARGDLRGRRRRARGGRPHLPLGAPGHEPGANMNFDRLRFVSERAELGEAREALLGAPIPERPGAFREFCAAIGPRVVTELNYHLASRSEAHIFVGLKTASRADAAGIAADLRRRGYPTVDLTDDEMAKLQVRYMAGGRAEGARGERLFRFEFPERPGALLQFLDTLGGRFNISLFHYRNDGADCGRVLCAFEAPGADLPELRAFLDRLGYESVAEQRNEAYRLFLAGP
jgi:threonine dehydratase